MSGALNHEEVEEVNLTLRFPHESASRIKGLAVNLTPFRRSAFAGGGPSATGDTYAGGIFRATRIAPSPSSGAYVFPAVVNLAGIRTAEGELDGTYRTSCDILVRWRKKRAGRSGAGHLSTAKK